MLPTPDLSQLDEAVVDAAFDRIVQIVSEYEPDMSADRGMLSDTVCGLHAILQTGTQQTIDSIQESLSILGEQGLPDEDDGCDAVFDAVASTYGVHRRPATRAYGQIVVVLQQERCTGMHLNALLRVHDKQFAVAGVPTNPIVVDAGRWAVTVDVKALEHGPASRLAKDTHLLPDRTPRGFVAAYAAEDFKGGHAKQTNTSMIASIRHSISAKVFSNRTNIRALIENADPATSAPVSEFARIQAISIIGMGDKEMTRDQRGVLPVSAGGRVDIYLRSQEVPQKTVLIKKPRLVTETDEYKSWALEIGCDDAPGFYEVLDVRPFGCLPGECNCEIITVELAHHIYAPSFTPDVRGLEDCGFSRYQAATVHFKQYASESTAEEFAVTVSVMPLVRQLQDYLTHPDVRPPGADILVRAAIPCWLEINIELDELVDEATEASIKTALVDYVHSLKFQHKLNSITLGTVIAPLLPDNNAIRGISMFGTIKKPNGDSVVTARMDPFIATVAGQSNISEKTVAMFLDPVKIVVSQCGTDTYCDAVNV